MLRRCLLHMARPSFDQCRSSAGSGNSSSIATNEKAPPGVEAGLLGGRPGLGAAEGLAARDSTGAIALGSLPIHHGLRSVAKMQRLGRNLKLGWRGRHGVGSARVCSFKSICESQYRLPFRGRNLVSMQRSARCWSDYQPHLLRKDPVSLTLIRAISIGLWPFETIATCG